MPPSPKPTKKVGFFSTLASLVVITCPCLLCFLAVASLKTSKSKDHKQLSKHQGGHYDHFFLLRKKHISINWVFPLAAFGGLPWLKPIPLGFGVLKFQPTGAGNGFRWLGLCLFVGF